MHDLGLEAAHATFTWAARNLYPSCSVLSIMGTKKRDGAQEGGEKRRIRARRGRGREGNTIGGNAVGSRRINCDRRAVS